MRNLLLAVIVGTSACAVTVGSIWIPAHRAFLEAEQKASWEKTQKRLQLRRQCAAKWPLRGERYIACTQGDDYVETRGSGSH